MVKAQEVDKIKILDGNDTEEMSKPTVKARKVDDTEEMSQLTVKGKVNDNEGMSKPTVKVQEVDGYCLMYLVHNEVGQVLAQVGQSKELNYCFLRKAGNMEKLLDLENHGLESKVYFDMNENIFCCIMFSLYSYVS